MRSTRVLAIGVVGVSLASMALVDRLVDRPITKLAAAANDAGTLDPLASAEDSGSSLWFCPSGESADGADTIITIVNPTNQAGTGTVSFLGNAGQRATANVQIGAYARLDVRAAETLSATGVGAIVEVNVGGLGVEQKVIRGGQTYGATCATSTSNAWYFADGNTTLSASSVLSVLNPFGEDAVLDISFVTERGAARPNDLQGFLVPASSMRRIDIGAYVRRRSQVSTVLKARVGRVAVDQTTSPDGARFSIVNGAPTLGSSWYFPAGRTNGVLRERYVLFNPTARDVSAQIDVVIEGGEVEPFELDVPARSRVDLIPNEESRIARDADYSVVVATDSPSLVVQRTLRASGIYRAGFATTLGSRRSAAAWLIPDVVASATRDDTISILNPTDTPTAVSLILNSGGEGDIASSESATGDAVSVDGKAPVALAGAENLLVKGSSRVTVRLSDFAAVASGSLVVRSSAAEIVVERTATAIKRRGRRTDRPAYVLADADSLAVRSDTSDTLPLDTNLSGDSNSEPAADGLPVDETYGAEPSIVETPADSAETSAAAVASIESGQKPARFGEFFLVVQAASSTGFATAAAATTTTTTTTTTTNTVSTATAGATQPTAGASTALPSTSGPSSTSSLAAPPSTSSLAALSSSTNAATVPTTTNSVSSGNTSTTTTTIVPSLASLPPRMGLGPVAKAGASTFSAMAIPLRPTP
jgi:hypothetical protein